MPTSGPTTDDVARADDVAPPDFLRLAGHPVRWRLLHELADSDRTVHELTARVDERQNLVSYHLARLRDGGLVRARRSSADRRDTYYTVDLHRVGALLAGTGAALHPGLRPPPPAPPPAPAVPVQVLFLCTGNSARSPMAAALVRARAPGAVEAVSAGSHPRPVHAAAVRVMHDRYGIDLAGHRPTHLDTFVDQPVDWVITLCDRVREACPELPGRVGTMHWSIPNPAEAPEGAAGADPFEQTAAELDARIGFLLAVLAERSPSS